MKGAEVMPYLLDLRFNKDEGWPKGWTIVDKINAYQHRVLDYSIAYYLFDRSIVADGRYDELCRYLVRLQRSFEEEAKKTVWWYAFHDFTGETGYHLWERLKEHHKTQIYNGIHSKLEYLGILN